MKRFDYYLEVFVAQLTCPNCSFRRHHTPPQTSFVNELAVIKLIMQTVFTLLDMLVLALVFKVSNLWLISFTIFLLLSISFYVMYALSDGDS